MLCEGDRLEAPPGLSLVDPGFDHTVLREFRSRLIKGGETNAA